jgi:hypothetical protein
MLLGLRDLPKSHSRGLSSCGSVLRRTGRREAAAGVQRAAAASFQGGGNSLAETPSRRARKTRDSGREATAIASMSAIGT